MNTLSSSIDTKPLPKTPDEEEDDYFNSTNGNNNNNTKKKSKFKQTKGSY